MSFYNQVGNIISGMSAEQAMISVLCEAGIQTLSLVGLGMVSRFAEGLMDGSFAARWGNWGSLEEDLAQAGIQGTSAANRVIYKEYATELRLEVISQRLEKSAVTKGMELNPAEYQVFRGGPGFAVGPNDTVIDRVTGLIKPTKGISLHIDPSTLERFGGGYQINGLSSELKIIQRGNDLGHFEIVPRAPMSPERYQELLEQVKIRY